jgi:collagenase-like PrtC family protease
MNITIPANFNILTLEKICKFNQQNENDSIFEVYGSLPFSGFAAGRSSSSLMNPSKEDFESYVNAAKKYGIIFNYTLNGKCLGSMEYDPLWRNKLSSFIDYLFNLGINNFTASSPAMVAIIHDLIPNAKITVSVTAEVATQQAALDYLKLGAQKVMVSVSLNRKFQRLAFFIKNIDAEVGLLLNSFCYPDCTYRTEHFNTSSHLTKNNPYLYDAIGSFDFNLCATEKLSNPERFLKAAWVRPEDIHFYEDLGVSFFKLEGRQRKNYDAVKVAQIYCNRSFKGNLCSLHTLFSQSNLSKLIYIDNNRLVYYDY